MEPVPSAQIWAGRVLSSLAIFFLIVDALVKVLKLTPGVQGTVELGYPESAVVTIGLLLLAGVALYLVPRTAVFGVIYLTAYLGGAVASQLRAGNPLFSHTLFPVYVATLLWGGMVLRDPRLRRVLLGGQSQ